MEPSPPSPIPSDESNASEPQTPSDSIIVEPLSPKDEKTSLVFDHRFMFDGSESGPQALAAAKTLSIWLTNGTAPKIESHTIRRAEAIKEGGRLLETELQLIHNVDAAPIWDPDVSKPTLFIYSTGNQFGFLSPQYPLPFPLHGVKYMGLLSVRPEEKKKIIPTSKAGKSEFQLSEKFSNHLARFVELQKSCQNDSRNPTVEELTEFAATCTLILMEIADTDSHRALTSAIFFFGSQSSGKSRLVSATLGFPAAFSASGTATRAPVSYLSVAGKDHQVKVNDKGTTVSQIAPELQKIMEVIEKNEKNKMQTDPVRVHISNPGQSGSIFIFDMPGLIANASPANAAMRDVVMQLSRDTFNKYIAVENASSIAVMVGRVKDAMDVQQVIWDSILQTDDKPTYLKDHLVIVLTHADLDIHELTEKNFLSGCRSWREIRTALFEPFWKLLGFEVPIFITSVDGSLDTSKVKELVTERGEDEMLKEYQNANKIAHEKLLKALKKSAKSCKVFDDNIEEYETFANEHLGVSQLVKYLRARQLQAFVNNIPTVLKLFGSELGLCESKLFSALQSQKEIRELPPQQICVDFFKIFGQLMQSILVGQNIPTEALNQKQHFIQDENGDGNVKKIDSFPLDRPAPTNWINNDLWEITTRDSAVDLMEEIELATNGVPPDVEAHIVPPMPTFPFHESDEIKNKETEESFQQRYAQASDKLITGSTRIKNLVRELCARIIWIDPGSIAKHELTRDQSNRFNVSVSLASPIFTVLERKTTSIFKGGIASYAARRFASIVWHCATVVLKYMETISQFKQILHDQQFLKDVKEVLSKIYYSLYVKKIQKMLENIASTINTLVDPFSSTFYELTAMMMTWDPNVVRDWVKENPCDVNYTSIMNGLLKTLDNPGQPVNVFAQNIVQTAKGSLNDIQNALNPSYDTCVTQWREAAVAFFDSILYANRLQSKEDCSDAIMYLMNLNKCPEMMDVKDHQYGVTENDLRRANYCFKRNFRSREFDFMRVLYNELMKDNVLSIDETRLAYGWQEFIKSFISHVRKPEADEKDNGKSTDILANASTTLSLLMNEKYKIPDTASELRIVVEQLQKQRKFLSDISQAIQWFRGYIDQNTELSEKLFTIKKTPAGRRMKPITRTLSDDETN